jgi:uncharacterized protein (DUF4415 family)
LYKTGRYKKWTDAIKAASKLVRPSRIKKIGAVKKATGLRKELARKKVRLVHGYETTKRVNTIVGHSSAIKQLLKVKLDRAVLSKYHAKTIRDKRWYQNEINKIKKEIRKHS